MASQSAKLYYNRLTTEGENINFDEHRQLPPFYDPIKYKRGQAFFREYFTSICLGYIVGLSLGLSDPKLNFILRHTNKSSQPKTAYKRYYYVVKHVLIWMEEDFESSTMWKSLNVVQSQHAKANKSTKMIKQRDLGLATMGFICPIFVNLDIFGMASAKTEDLEAFLHMWRNLSYVMGTNDLFNPCTTESVDIVSSISKEIALHCAGYISNNMWEYHSMLDAFCRGFSILLPIPNEKVMVEYCLKNIVQKCDQNFSYQTDYVSSNKIALKLMEVIGYIQRFKIVRFLCNTFGRFFVEIKMIFHKL